MKLMYRVHRISPHEHELPSKLPTGEDAMGKFPSVELELVAEGHHHGTILVRLFGKEAAGAIEEFKRGDLIEADFSVARPEPAIAPAPAK